MVSSGGPPSVKVMIHDSFLWIGYEFCSFRRPKTQTFTVLYATAVVINAIRNISVSHGFAGTDSPPALVRIEHSRPHQCAQFHTLHFATLCSRAEPAR